MALCHPRQLTSRSGASVRAGPVARADRDGLGAVSGRGGAGGRSPSRRTLTPVRRRPCPGPAAQARRAACWSWQRRWGSMTRRPRRRRPRRGTAPYGPGSRGGDSPRPALAGVGWSHRCDDLSAGEGLRHAVGDIDRVGASGIDGGDDGGGHSDLADGDGGAGGADRLQSDPLTVEFGHDGVAAGAGHVRGYSQRRTRYLEPRRGARRLGVVAAQRPEPLQGLGAASHAQRAEAALTRNTTVRPRCRNPGTQGGPFSCRRSPAADLRTPAQRLWAALSVVRAGAPRPMRLAIRYRPGRPWNSVSRCLHRSGELPQQDPGRRPGRRPESTSESRFGSA